MTARVSVLERLVAKQTTVSQEWKMLQDATKATQAQRKQGESYYHRGRTWKCAVISSTRGEGGGRHTYARECDCCMCKK